MGNIKKIKRPPNPKPWDAMIVGIDPSSKAHGWAMTNRGKYYDSGVVYKASELDQLVVDMEEASLQPYVYVSEDWMGAIPTIKKLCEERGRWRQLVEAFWPCSKWATVNVSTWSSAFGLPKSSRERKGNSIVIAQGIKGSPVKDDNEADAILIASFASHWADLDKLGLKQTK